MNTCKLSQGVLFLLICISLITQIQGGIFNILQSGARGDGVTDNSEAIMRAWRDACGSSQASTVLTPKGVFMVNAVTFQGPCKAPITFQSQGTWKAPLDAAKQKSQDGWIIFQNVDAMTFTGGVYDGQGSLAWTQNNCAKTGKCSSLPMNFRFNAVTNTMIQGMTSANSKLFHMNLINCKNVTFVGVTIDAPETSLNTDGIHIGRSTGITIRDSTIKTGDDCVSLGDGSKQVLVEKTTCGPGHGISVGSLGKYQNEEPVEEGVTVRGCKFTNTMNGVRVKTWPASPNGVARDLHFEDLTMNNVGTPILIDQEYCPYNQCQLQNPSRVKISDVTFKGIRGTTSTQLAVKLVCSKGLPCENVKVSDINLVYKGKEGPATSQCTNVKPAISGKLFPPACAKAA